MRVARKNKVDTNQAEIVQALTDAGYSVQSLGAVGNGCPDLLVGGIDRRTGMATNWLMEVKAPRGKMNTIQQEWHASWRGLVYVVRTATDALRIVGVVENDESSSSTLQQGHIPILPQYPFRDVLMRSW